MVTGDRSRAFELPSRTGGSAIEPLRAHRLDLWSAWRQPLLLSRPQLASKSTPAPPISLGAIQSGHPIRPGKRFRFDPCLVDRILLGATESDRSRTVWQRTLIHEYGFRLFRLPTAVGCVGNQAPHLRHNCFPQCKRPSLPYKTMLKRQL